MRGKAPIATLFGQRVRSLRRLSRQTQEDLAHGAQVSTKTISEIERGIGNPTLDLIARLATALNVEEHELFLYESIPAEAERSTTPHKLAERMAGYMSGRSQKDVTKALRILELVLEGTDAAK